jgi:hypothetical protein
MQRAGELDTDIDFPPVHAADRIHLASFNVGHCRIRWRRWLFDRGR